MKFCTTLGGTQYKCEAWSPHRPVCNCPEKTGRTPHVTEAAAAASHNWCCIRHKAEREREGFSAEEREGYKAEERREGYIAERRKSYIAKRREGYIAKEREGHKAKERREGYIAERRVAPYGSQTGPCLLLQLNMSPSSRADK